MHRSGVKVRFKIRLALGVNCRCFYPSCYSFNRKAKRGFLFSEILFETLSVIKQFIADHNRAVDKRQVKIKVKKDFEIEMISIRRFNCVEHEISARGCQAMTHGYHLNLEKTT